VGFGEAPGAGDRRGQGHPLRSRDLRTSFVACAEPRRATAAPSAHVSGIMNSHRGAVRRRAADADGADPRAPAPPPRASRSDARGRAKPGSPSCGRVRASPHSSAPLLTDLFGGHRSALTPARGRYDDSPIGPRSARRRSRHDEARIPRTLAAPRIPVAPPVGGRVDRSDHDGTSAEGEAEEGSGSDEAAGEGGSKRGEEGGAAGQGTEEGGSDTVGSGGAAGGGRVVSATASRAPATGTIPPSRRARPSAAPRSGRCCRRTRRRTGPVAAWRWDPDRNPSRSPSRPCARRSSCRRPSSPG